MTMELKVYLLFVLCGPLWNALEGYLECRRLKRPVKCVKGIGEQL